MRVDGLDISKSQVTGDDPTIAAYQNTLNNAKTHAGAHSNSIKPCDDGDGSADIN